MPKLPETKRKAVGWVIVALPINVASIGVGFGIYDAAGAVSGLQSQQYS